MKHYSISLGIVTRNRSKQLLNCLNSLTRLSVYPLEVLIVDNGSSDSTKKIVKSFEDKLPIKYIYEDLRGTSFARNRILNEAIGEILAFTDDDCEVYPDFIEKIQKSHKKYPKTAAVQGNIVIYPKKGIIPKIFKSSYFAWVKRYLQTNNHCYFLDTANASFKLSILKKKKIWFDDNIKYYCDDIDIAFQLLSKSQQIIHDQDVKVKAWVKTNYFDFFKMRYLKGFAQAYLYYKWSFFENPIFISIGSKRIKLLDQDQIDFRKLSIFKQRDLTSIKKSGIIFKFFYSASEYFSDFFFQKGIQNGNEFINGQIVNLQNKILKSDLKKESQLEVAVITRNRQKSLSRLLASLVRQTVYPNKIIIVDNGSSDKTNEVVRAYSKILPIKYVYEPKIGIPSARNRALAVGESEFLVFIDDDCEAPANWIEEVIKSHKKYSKVAAIQGKSLNMPEESIFSIIFEANYSFWFFLNSYKKNYLNVCDTKNLSIRLKKVKDLKIRFDEEFKKGSDVDFAKQLIHKGLQIRYVPEVCVKHWGRTNIMAFSKQLYQNGRAQVKLDFKWPQFQKIFQSSDKKLFEQISLNIGFGQPIYRRFLIKKLFYFCSWIFEKGKNHEKLFFSKEIRTEKLFPDLAAYKRKEDISVGIVTNNRPNNLEKCLFSLVSQTVAPKEVVIIDSSDNDLTQNIVKSFSKYLPIKYFHDKRVGISWARNRVLKIATGKILFCLDDDGEAFPDWIEQMLKAHKQYPQALAIQGKCLIYPDSGVVSNIVQRDYNSWISRNLKDNNELLVLDMENASFKKPNLDKLGINYDDSFKEHYYCEDIDFGFQLLLKNQKIIFWSDAIVGTWRRKSLVSLMKQRFLKGLSRASLDFKWSLTYDKKGLIFGDKEILFKKNSSNIRKILAAPFDQKMNLFSPLLAGLPNVGIIGRFFEPIILFTYHRMFLFSYEFQRMRINSDLSRMNSYPKKDEVLKKQSELTLSVMILTKDRPEHLKRCLESLILQSCKPEKVIIVDSSDLPAESVIEMYKKDLNIQYVYLLSSILQKKRGFGVARNTAISYAKTDLIATLDDDALAHKDWCKNIINTHAKFPEVLAIQGRIQSIPKNALVSIVVQMHMERWFLANLEHDNNLTIVTTKNTSFKLTAFKKLHLKFKDDLLFGLYGAEDRDIAFQIISQKKRILYMPDIVVSHTERGSILEYLRQQYRKGYSYGLIGRIWKKELQRKKLYFPFPKFIEPVYWFFIHPVTRHKPSRIIQVLITYYLVEFFFSKGIKDADNHFKRLQHMVFVKKESVSALSLVVVILVTDRHRNLENILYSLINQTVLPTKVIIIDTNLENKSAEAISFFTKVIPIEYIRSNIQNFSVLKNEILRVIKENIVVFLDDGYEVSRSWVEEIIKAHKKYPHIPVIQGRTKNLPKGGIYSTVLQFNRQTNIRDFMGKSRGLYWKWLEGGLKKDFPAFPLYIENSSIKSSMIKKFGLKFDEKNSDFADAFFSFGIYQRKSSILHYPKILALDRENGYFLKIAEKGFAEGSLLFNLKELLPNEFQKITQTQFIKRFLTFIYFCIKNRYFFTFPALSAGYLIYQLSFIYGFKKAKDDQLTKRVVYKINNAS